MVAAQCNCSGWIGHSDEMGHVVDTDELPATFMLSDAGEAEVLEFGDP